MDQVRRCDRLPVEQVLVRVAGPIDRDAAAVERDDLRYFAAVRAGEVGIGVALADRLSDQPPAQVPAIDHFGRPASQQVQGSRVDLLILRVVDADADAGEHASHALDSPLHAGQRLDVADARGVDKHGGVEAANEVAPQA